jgi:hypothetical protein
MKREDPLGREAPMYKRNPQVERPSTLRPKGGARTTLDKGASATEHLSVMPNKKRKLDPYGPSDVSGYSPSLRGAVLEIANLGLAGKPTPKRKR